MSARNRVAIQWTLIALVVLGLAIDAFVHFDLASAFKNNKTSTVSEATLFRVEAVIALIAAAALLIWPRRLTAGFAFLVAAGSTAAVLLYRYVDVGALGPLPNMYDPYWEPTGKWLSAIGEVVAAVCGLALFAILHRAAGRGSIRHSVPSAGLPTRS